MEGFLTSIVWNPWVPMRVCFFAWETIWKKILTLDQQKRRGWYLPSRCYLCKSEKKVNKLYLPSLSQGNYVVASYLCSLWCWVGNVSFFDRKRRRNILIKRMYKRRMRNPPTKEKQNYKESNIRKYKVKTSKLFILWDSSWALLFYFWVWLFDFFINILLFFELSY